MPVDGSAPSQEQERQETPSSSLSELSSIPSPNFSSVDEDEDKQSECAVSGQERRLWAGRIYNQQEKETAQPHSTIAFAFDEGTGKQLEEKGFAPELAITLPSSMIGPILELITKHPDANAELSQLFTHPIAQELHEMLTQDAVPVTMKSTIPTKRVPQLFDDKGMLTLEAYKEVPIETEGGVSSRDAQPLDGNFSQQTTQNPVTPRARTWGFSSFLPSAQTVTRFLPGMSRRILPAVSSKRRTPPTSPIQTTANRPKAEASPATPSQIEDNQRPSQSEPRPGSGNGKKIQPNRFKLSCNRTPISTPS